MSALLISSIAFAVIFGGALLGIYASLSKDQPREDIKDVIRLSSGLIATIAALVLSLLIASAKNSYDARNTQIKQITAGIVLLDNLLEQYGPDTRNLRVALRNAVPSVADRIWSERSRADTAPFSPSAEALAFMKKVQELEPNSDVKRTLQARILAAIFDLGQSRLALFTQSHDSIPAPFLAILIFWLAIIFASFGLFVEPNRIVIGTFFVCTLSVSAAIFLILEMDQPFAGLLQISDEPMRRVLAPLAP